MKTITITLDWGALSKDMQANTYKLGFLSPREDGREGETQISADEALDVLIIKRNTLEAISDLLTRLKRFSPAATQDGGSLGTQVSSIHDADPTANPAVADTSWAITLSVTQRNDNISNQQASNLAHAFVVAYVCTEWYRTINAETMKAWDAKREEVITKLLAAIYHKTEPVLTTS